MKPGHDARPVIHHPLQSARRGSLLIFVMMTGSIISVICLGALIVQNVSLTQASTLQDATEARCAARSAIAVASREIVESSDWRTSRTPGRWYSSIPLNDGSWSLVATNPLGTNFTSSSADPVMLAGSADFGRAVQKSSALHEVETVVRQPALMLACAGKRLTLDHADITGAGWIGAVEGITMSGTNSIHCDLLTGGATSGGSAPHRVVTASAIESVPTFSDFTEIVALGTLVDASSIPTATASTAQVIRNGDFQRDGEGWQASHGGVLVEQKNGGVLNSECIQLSQRPSDDCGISYDVSGVVTNRQSVTVSAAVLPLMATTKFELCILATTTSGITTAASWTSANVSAGTSSTSFQTISTTLTPEWSGRLIKASLVIRTSGGGTAGAQDFRADNITLTSLSAPPGKAVYRRVVSSATNPFSVSPNANGIYVLDLGGADLNVSSCVIVGTLVIRNAGTVTIGPGAVQWRPAKPGLPALIADSNIRLTFNRFAINERELNVNLNPSGTPDEFGSTDSSMNDLYLPEIRGLVYASRNLSTTGDIRASGPLLAADNIQFSDRVELTRKPQLLTTPRSSTHCTRTFIRNTNGMTRGIN